MLPLPEEARVDVTLFANYYGTVKQTQQFNDPHSIQLTAGLLDF